MEISAGDTFISFNLSGSSIHRCLCCFFVCRDCEVKGSIGHRKVLGLSPSVGPFHVKLLYSCVYVLLPEFLSPVQSLQGVSVNGVCVLCGVLVTRPECVPASPSCSRPHPDCSTVTMGFGSYRIHLCSGLETVNSGEKQT